MTEHGFDEAIVDLARGGPAAPAGVEDVRRHLAQCSICAARFEREAALTRGLRALADAASAEGASASMEDSLLTAFAATHRRTAPAIAGETRQPWMALAAALIMAAALTAGWRGFESSRHPLSSAPVSEPAAGFVPWPGASALPAFESGQLVRTELPASVLPLLGLGRADLEGKVQADVLVGQDGFVRAVRLAR
jgi:hypothetical protein